MRNSLRIFIILIFISLFTGCQKEGVIPIEDDSVVFEVEGYMGNSSFHWSAGLSDYYMYTNVDIDEESGGFIYEGYLQPICDETFCPEGLAIRFYDLENKGLEELLTQNTISFAYNPDGILENRRFLLELESVKSNHNPESYLWFVNEKEGSGYAFTDTVSGNEVLVCMTVTSGCASQICKTIHLDGSDPCALDMGFESEYPGLYEVQALSSGAGPFEWSWNTGSIGEDVVFIEEDGIQYVCVTMLDAHNCLAVNCSEVLFENGEIYACDNEFVYSTTLLQNSEVDFSNKVEVIYTDESGNQFYSSAVEQLNAEFVILDIIDYELNAEGNPTYKIQLKLQCDLASEEGSIIRAAEVNATFGIAYQ